MRKGKKKKLIVFDMDGVLIDVSRSYREAVRETARLFFKGGRGWEDLPKPLFPLTDLARVKQSGGLNNDWDLTSVVVSLLCRCAESLAAGTTTDPWKDYRLGISRCDLSGMALFLKTEPFPLTLLMKQSGKSMHEFVSACYTGDVGSGNILKQIFQEIYLGAERFQANYKIPPRSYRGKGYIQRETLLIPPSILQRLSDRHILAIATGRPKIEADYPLDRFSIRRFFSTVLTLDDCLQEEQKRMGPGAKKTSLSKPNPFMLDAIASACREDISGYYYIGDMPDDMIAAARAKTPYIGIGALAASPDKAFLKSELQNAGAAQIIDDLDTLPDLVDSLF